MATSPTPALIREAPKVLLHDHLDGGLRPRTVIELAAEQGYRGLPTTDPDELAAWFVEGGARRSLPRYLEPFQPTVGAMQTPEALERWQRACAADLAGGGVVSAEVLCASDAHTHTRLPPDAGFATELQASERAAWQGGAIRSA